MSTSNGTGSPESYRTLAESSLSRVKAQYDQEGGSEADIRRWLLERITELCDVTVVRLADGFFDPNFVLRRPGTEEIRELLQGHNRRFDLGNEQELGDGEQHALALRMLQSGSRENFQIFALGRKGRLVLKTDTTGVFGWMPPESVIRARTR